MPADGFDLLDRAQQKFQIAFEVARLALDGIAGILPESFPDEVMDQDFRVALPVTIDAAVALLHPVRIPGDLVVNEARTVILQINPLGRRICGDQNPHR